MYCLQQVILGLAILSSIQGQFLPSSPCLQAHYVNASASNFIAAPNKTFSLTATNESPAVVIVDYLESVEGFSSFEVVSVQGDASVLEITYAESKAALDSYMSDGPLPLAAAMDTYRVNRYNIASPGKFRNRLIQGAFRYQKFNLSSEGSLTINNIGVKPSVNNTPIPQLPGSFNSSSEKLNRIWSVGARTVQMTEIPKDTIPDFFEVSPEGTLVDSLAPQTHGSAVAAQLLFYTMNFEVNPLVGGFGFTVLSSTLNAGIYISCNVEENKITAYAGSTEENSVLQSIDLPTNLSLALDKWHSVQANVAMTTISVTIDGVHVLDMSQAERMFGSFGFGASYGHRALFRNLSVTSQGEEIFSYSLTDKSFLADFFMGSNPLNTVVDGSRRDRIAYTGDLDIAGTAALASTHGLEYILGSLDLFGSYQASPGFFIPTAKIQQDALKMPLDVNITGLIGYSFNFVTAVSSVYMHTGDAKFAQKWAPKIQKMLDWADSQCLENGLFNVSDASFGGDWNYYDPAQSGVVTKFNVLYAYALQESQPLLKDGGIDSQVYQSRLEDLRLAIDNILWSDHLQAYYLSQDLPSGFGQDSNAIAILAGVNVNSSHSSGTIMSTMTQLMQHAGPLAFSTDIIAEGFQSYISPYASAYHLRAAMAMNDGQEALKLLENLWFPMANPGNSNYTGTFWETLDQDGRPGLKLVTSLCHGWSAGPTAELSKYVLGATPSRPGWVEFNIAPLTLGLTFAQGRVPTNKGNVYVDWRFDNEGLLTMVIEAPIGTRGKVKLPKPLVVAVDDAKFLVDGIEREDLDFEVIGGTKFVLSQLRKP